ncbi:ataxin 3 variant ref [Moniliophthora roreri]|nr:ataxin 3 variant ref [Moniliophthora roreri]
MDDTGFFSVQVLENALLVWGLSLVRWRGQQMRPYQDHPQCAITSLRIFIQLLIRCTSTQLAFILNHQQHWYTLRRFGPASLDLDSDPGNGHWFNLNSFNASPEWVGKLYLGIFLQEAERQGYSVFAVTQSDPSAPLALPRTNADDIAASIPEGSFSNNPGTQVQGGSEQHGFEDIEGLEDEDMELQAALAASLGSGPSTPPQLVRRPVPLPSTDSGPPSGPGSGTLTPARSGFLSPLGLPTETADFDDLDPVAASRERSRRRLLQMQAEQEQAHRELWDEGNRPNTSREDEYEEMLRRAIAESEAMAKNSGQDRLDIGEDREGSMDVDNDSPELDFTGPRLAHNLDRVYDDDDAGLQAALKASLEQVPHDWVAPDIQSAVPSATQDHGSGSLAKAESSHDMEEEEDVPVSDAPAQIIDVEEMRKRRLARFGG